MLTTTRIKVILNRPDLDDQQIEEIRDSFKRLAEIVFDKWHRDIIINLNNKIYDQSEQ